MSRFTSLKEEREERRRKDQEKAREKVLDDQTRQKRISVFLGAELANIRSLIREYISARGYLLCGPLGKTLMLIPVVRNIHRIRIKGGWFPDDRGSIIYKVTVGKLIISIWPGVSPVSLADNAIMIEADIVGSYEERDLFRGKLKEMFSGAYSVEADKHNCDVIVLAPRRSVTAVASSRVVSSS